MKHLIFSGTLFLIGCTWQEIQEATYHAGQDFHCVQENRNHPQAEVRSMECYTHSPALPYSDYIKEREKLEKK